METPGIPLWKTLWNSESRIAQEADVQVHIDWPDLVEKERVIGFEPTTATLATWGSTAELHPRVPAD